MAPVVSASPPSGRLRGALHLARHPEDSGEQKQQHPSGEDRQRGGGHLHGGMGKTVSEQQEDWTPREDAGPDRGGLKDEAPL